MGSGVHMPRPRGTFGPDRTVEPQRLPKAEPKRVVLALRNQGAVPSFQPYPARLRVVVARLGLGSAVAEALERLMGQPGLHELTAAEKDALLDCFEGPTPRLAEAPRTTVARAWESRRISLAGALREALRASRPGQERLETVRDVLFASNVPVFFLSSLELRRGLVVFGDPSDATSLSYGQCTTRDSRTGVLSGTLSSPERSVESHWMEPMMDRSYRFSALELRVSRHDEVRLVRWIEENFAFDGGLGSRGEASASPSSFLEATLRFARALARNRRFEATPRIFLGGRPLPHRDRPA